MIIETINKEINITLTKKIYFLVSFTHFIVSNIIKCKQISLHYRYFCVNLTVYYQNVTGFCIPSISSEYEIPMKTKSRLDL